MGFDLDFSELGIEVPEDKVAALKEHITAKHQEALEQEVGGLKAKRDELLEAQKRLKEQLSQFEGIDPERAKKLEEQIAQSKEAKLIAEGKLDEVITQRTERMQAEYERRLQEATTTAEQAKGFAERFKGRVLSDEIRAAASKVGMVDAAAEDATLRAQSFFEVNDEGNVVAKEDAGLDASGKPLTVQTWLQSMKEAAPHWFLQPKGSGALGSTGSSASPRAWEDAKTTADKVEYIKRKHAG